MKRFSHWLRSLPYPPARYQRSPVVAISDSVAHFCDECRHFIAVSLSDDACPRCGSTEIKYAVAWMRTPGEQTERAMARRRAPLMHKAAQLIPTPRDADASTADIVSLRRKRTTER